LNVLSITIFSDNAKNIHKKTTAGTVVFSLF